MLAGGPAAQGAVHPEARPVTMPALTDAWWPVAPFGLQKAGLARFSESFPLHREPRSGRLYAQPEHLMEFIREALKARTHAVGTWRTDWRKRLIRLPI